MAGPDNKKRIKQLHGAAETGSIKELKQLLESPLSLDEKNERGETALYVAVTKGHRKFAETLLEAGADPNIATDGGSTVLHAAAMSGMATLIKKLSTSNRSGKGSGISGKVPSVPEKVSGIPDKGPGISDKGRSIPDKSPGIPNKGPGILSKVLGIPEICAGIPSKGPAISEKDNGKTSTEKKKKKADPSPKNVSPKEWQDIYKKCENMVLTDSEDEEDKVKVCEFQLPVIEAYLDSLFNPNKDEYQLNVMRQFLQGILMNLGKRMNVNSNLGRGATLLHLAAVCRADCTVKILLNRGASVTATNLDGVTPLMMGCAGGSVEVVRALVEAGADPSVADDTKRTALHHAARLGSVAVIKYLLSLGVEIDPQDNDGNTPLHIASHFEAGPEVIMALLKGGANVLARNYDRLYPFSLACDALTYRLLHPPGIAFGNLLSHIIS